MGPVSPEAIEGSGGALWFCSSPMAGDGAPDGSGGSAETVEGSADAAGAVCSLAGAVPGSAVWEILALITQGKSNADVARLTYLSPNTVKSYIRTIYRKLGVGSRTQAVLWGVKHGFTPDHHRIEHWRGGP
ncbi:MAG: hypothetical protein QOD10_2573 [Mycobacterium sp.]|nr:hypothetical protein [Mycobacterium sp.]